MLILRRKAGESVLIGNDIEVEVVELGSGRVKLGIKAPSEVFIVRKEIRLAEQQNLAAAHGFASGRISTLVSHLRDNILPRR